LVSRWSRFPALTSRRIGTYSADKSHRGGVDYQYFFFDEELLSLLHSSSLAHDFHHISFAATPTQTSKETPYGLRQVSSSLASPLLGS
jgi:hypothetical protein